MAKGREVVDVKVDTDEIRRFVRDLRTLAPDIATSFRERLKVVGGIVASEARDRAADFSRTIPPSIRVRVSGAKVSVTAGSARAPMAGLFELGNRGRGSAALAGQGFFRHPVFGSNAEWVTQPMHPFLQPALDAKSEEVTKAALDAIDETVKEFERHG